MDKKSDKKMSEHFINYSIKGKKFDFNDFKTPEELTKYEEELEEYLIDKNADK